MSKVILCDMDDVMEDLGAAWISELNDIYTRDVKMSDIQAWNFQLVYPDLSEEQITAPLMTERLWNKVRPKTNAAKYLKQLQEDGYLIYIVTSTHYKNINFKIDYILKRYFPFIPIENLITTHCKQMIRGDFLIDDNPENLLPKNGIEPVYTPILFTANHNLKYVDKDLNRVYNWEEVYNFIKEHS